MNKKQATPDASLTISQSDFSDLIMLTVTPEEKRDKSLLKIEGDKKVVETFIDLIELPTLFFNIVTP